MHNETVADEHRIFEIAVKLRRQNILLAQVKQLCRVIRQVGHNRRIGNFFADRLVIRHVGYTRHFAAACGV